MLGLHCSVGFSLVVMSGGYSLVVVCGLLIMVASFIAEHGPQGEGNGSPLQYSCPENFIDAGAWWGHKELVTTE